MLDGGCTHCGWAQFELSEGMGPMRCFEDEAEAACMQCLLTAKQRYGL